GFEVHVIDPRRAFATAERLPGVSVSTEWPEQAIARIGIAARTAVVTLSHDPKLDDPALIAALRSRAFYIGALGSTRTHAKRVARLTDAGLGDSIGRIHAPVGLDLGGRAPVEIAVAIVAQLIRARYAKAATEPAVEAGSARAAQAQSARTRTRARIPTAARRVPRSRCPARARRRPGAAARPRASPRRRRRSNAARRAGGRCVAAPHASSAPASSFRGCRR